MLGNCLSYPLPLPRVERGSPEGHLDQSAALVVRSLLLSMVACQPVDRLHQHDVVDHFVLHIG
jgi:hypothetical protein